MKKKIYSLIMVVFLFLFVPCFVYANEVENENPPLTNEEEPEVTAETVIENNMFDESSLKNNQGILRIAAKPIYINGINVATGGYWKNNGKKGTKSSYNIYYNTATNTLYLKSAIITTKSTGTLESSGITSGILSEDKLNIVLYGTNKISVADADGAIVSLNDITIDGKSKGKLYVTSKTTGITSYNGNISINNVAYLSVVVDDTEGLIGIGKIGDNKVLISNTTGYINSPAGGITGGEKVSLYKSNFKFNNGNVNILSKNIYVKNSDIISSNAKINVLSTSIYDTTAAIHIVDGDIYADMDASSTNTQGFLSTGITNIEGKSRISILNSKKGIKTDVFDIDLSTEGYIVANGTTESDAVSFTTKNYAPSTRTQSSTTGVIITNKNCAATFPMDNKMVVLSWAEVTKAEGYQIQTYYGKKWITLGNSDVPAYLASYSKFKSNTTYKFRVRAYETVGGKKYYFYNVPTLYGKTGISTPTVKLYNVNGDNKLTWNKITGATIYEVLRSPSASNDYTSLTKTTKNYYTDTTAVAGNEYKYAVKAYRTSTFGEFTNTFSGQKESKYVTRSSMPTYVKLTTEEGKNKLTFNLDSIMLSKIGFGYQIYRATSKTGKYTMVKEVNSFNTVSLVFTDTDVKAGKGYYYKVRSYVTNADTRYYSGFTSVKYIKTK